MRYVLAFILPPLAIALCKRWGHFTANLIIWLVSIPMIAVLGIGIVTWILCVVHALVVCRMSSFDKRVDRMVAAIQSQSASSSTRRV